MQVLRADCRDVTWDVAVAACLITTATVGFPTIWNPAEARECLADPLEPELPRGRGSSRCLGMYKTPRRSQHWHRLSDRPTFTTYSDQS